MTPKIKMYGLWALKIIAGLAFLTAGLAKLAGAQMMVGTFDAIGFGQWFRYVTGAIEVGSGILLFVPGKQGLAAILLLATMVGATLAHILVLGVETMLPAIVLGLITATIAYAHRDQLFVEHNLKSA